MTALSDALAVRVSKIIGQFGSDNPHVVTTAAAVLKSTLSANGCDLNDLAARIAEGPRETIRLIERAPRPEPQPFNYGAWQGAYHRPHPNGPHRHRVTRCQQVAGGRLSAWETSFLASLDQQLGRGRSLTPKQVSILADIAQRLGVAG